jgi:hypothetical protein
MRFRSCILTILALFGLIGMVRADDRDHVVDLARAAQYFKEFHALAKIDNGQLWGIALDGPMMFVDPRTRQIVANQADADGNLRPDRGVFVGELPDRIPPANYAIHWAGVNWTMVLWPLPAETHVRAVLMMHESWHRIQALLRLPPASPANRHLDTLEGRIWLQLEWRALARALAQRGENRRAAIEDVLVFRAHRWSLFQAATKEEIGLEMNEGLAEYTGVKLSGMAAAEQSLYAIKQLERRPSSMPTFVRSFAYLSGPAYGLLLDSAGADWRKGLKSGDDLGSLLQRAHGLALPKVGKDELEGRVARYDGTALRSEEAKRELERQERQAKMRALFVDGPVLTLPLRNAQFSFDPNGSQPLGKHGTVYPVLQLSDSWGTLRASKGALMASDFQKAFVVAPRDAVSQPVKGERWELHLKEGWALVPAARKGDFELRKEK